MKLASIFEYFEHVQIVNSTEKKLFTGWYEIYYCPEIKLYAYQLVPGSLRSTTIKVFPPLSSMSETSALELIAEMK